MNNFKNKNQKGAALLIYLLIMTFFIAILMTTTYSRLLLSVKRAQSSTDSLSANYRAESEAYDYIARLSGNYLTQNPLDFEETKMEGSTKLKIKGSQNGNVQTISVTVDRPFASSKIVADRTVEVTGSSTDADILLGLDCTGSMSDNLTTGNGKTRIANLKAAALNFVNSVPNTGRFHVGAYVFGINALWMKTSSGKEVTLSPALGLTEVASAIRDGFDDSDAVDSLGSSLNWQLSTACRDVLDSTSIGTAFTFGQQYFSTIKKANTKQVEIVITDGEPNSRIPDPGCAPSLYCPFRTELCNKGTYGTCEAAGGVCVQAGVQYLGCSVASSDSTFTYNYVDASGKTTALVNKGLRDPSIDTYAVTISTSPSGDASKILSTYLGANYFPADKASNLTNILSNILNDIITKHESISIKKVLPGQ